MQDNAEPVGVCCSYMEQNFAKWPTAFSKFLVARLLHVNQFNQTQRQEDVKELPAHIHRDHIIEC